MASDSNNQMMDEAKSKAPNPEEIAKYYLKKHRITDLFDNITAALVYERPGNSLFFYNSRCKNCVTINFFSVIRLWNCNHVLSI